jgi:chromosome partitioning protein
MMLCSHAVKEASVRTIAVANQKGGVAKTVTAVNLGAALVSGGQKVLLIDLDPQGNLSLNAGAPSAPGEAPTYDLLAGKDPVQRLVTRTQWEGLDIISSGIALSSVEVQFAKVKDGSLRLRDRLKSLKGYDFAVIDTPPSLGFLTLNALSAAGEVLVPVQCSFLAMHGLRQLLDTIDAVRGHGNPGLRVCGLALTMYDRRTGHSREVVHSLQNHFGDLVFDTLVPRTVAFDYSTVAGVPLVYFDPDSAAARAYRNLAREVLKRA